LREAARWVVGHHAEWGGELVEKFNELLKVLPNTPQGQSPSATTDPLENMLVTFAAHPAVQQLLADAIAQHATSAGAQALALRVMAKSTLKGPPKSWLAAIARALTSTNGAQLAQAIAPARRFPVASAADPKPSNAL